nr:transmembrane protein 254-like [Procambarus clarkii]
MATPRGPREMTPDYFILTPPPLTIFIASGLIMMGLTWQCPEVFEHPLLGPFGQLLAWLGAHHNALVRLVFVPTVVVHVLEVVWAVCVCRGRLGLTRCTTTCWALQISVVGIFSLRYLIWPLEDARHASRSKKEA